MVEVVAASFKARDARADEDSRQADILGIRMVPPLYTNGWRRNLLGD